MPTLWFCTTILYYGYTRCYHRGKLGEVCILFAIFYDSMIISKYNAFLKKKGIQASVPKAPTMCHQKTPVSERDRKSYWSSLFTEMVCNPLLVL